MRVPDAAPPIALLSPKGRLYRHRFGIFKRSLRYPPLALPTLASLIPPEIPHRVSLIDEGIRDIPLDLQADIIGIHCDHSDGTAQLLARRPLSGTGRHRGARRAPRAALAPDDALPHADAIVVGYAEESWPRLLRDVINGRLAPRYDQIPGLSLAGLPPVRRDRCRRATTLLRTSSRRHVGAHTRVISVSCQRHGADISCRSR